MKVSRTTRRRFIQSALLLVAPAAVAADARWLEPDWIKVSHLRLAQGKPSHRFVHFTDFHHKGDRALGEHLVKLINSQSPDFVCFTGDIIEEAKYLPEALEILSGIQSPLYGIPGNHDYWSHAPFDGIIKCFAATGGAWLLDEQMVIAGGKINLSGIARCGPKYPPPSPKAGLTNILMVHYPAWVKDLPSRKFDLILAGHSHGGQVRIPFYGPIIVPYSVDEYDLGLFQTQAGPLFVGSGIGWYPVPIRFNCRPEITVVEI
jgi:predicted MPP superfamily phosphohydrolase